MSNIQFKSPAIYLVATLFSLPNTALIWFIIMYPVSAFTGQFPHFVIHFITLFVVLMIIWSWTLLGSENIPEIVYRSCRFGSIISLLLPVVTGTISFLWMVSDAGRPAGFLDQFSALEIPLYTTIFVFFLLILFLTGSYLAARHMDGIPF